MKTKKMKPGPKPLPAGEARKETIEFRVNRNEKSEIERLAKLGGASVSEHVRRRALA